MNAQTHRGSSEDGREQHDCGDAIWTRGSDILLHVACVSTGSQLVEVKDKRRIHECLVRPYSYHMHVNIPDHLDVAIFQH